MSDFVKSIIFAVWKEKYAGGDLWALDRDYSGLSVSQ